MNKMNEKLFKRQNIKQAEKLKCREKEDEGWFCFRMDRRTDKQTFVIVESL